MIKDPYYVTTPIYYVNDRPHIGHVYTSIACDVMARFKRLDGYDVRFLTGTDEHGLKIAQRAEEEGTSPKEYVDQVSEHFRALSPNFNLSNDDFIRTSEDRHIKAAQALWSALMERDEIYLGSYAGWYAVRDEAYYSEAEIVTGEDGNKYYPPSGAQVEWVEEPSYFFRLSKWAEPLLKYYHDNPDFILPESRRNEVMRFVEGGLNDLSVSRTSFSWGVPVPGDRDHIMYVWLDALTNYMTSVGYPDTGNPSYKTYWPADLHVVGKDILRFHAVYWPAFLMAADLPLPKRIFAHGWWTNEGQKISKSLGNVINPDDLKARYGLDALRYYLLRQVPFGQDGDFSHEHMVSRMNTDLANDLGNMAQRVLSMIHKNCETKAPALENLTAEDQEILTKAHGALEEKVRPLMEEQSFDRALKEIWDLIGDANRYVDAQAPWSLRKSGTEEDLARMQAVLATCLEVIRTVALLIQPIVPEAANRLLDQLAIPEDKRDFSALGPTEAIPSGTSLPAPEGIFPRHVEEAA